MISLIFIFLSSTAGAQPPPGPPPPPSAQASPREAMPAPGSHAAAGPGAIPGAEPPAHPGPGDEATAAKAQLIPRSGSKANGTVEFIETPEGLKVTYDVKGLKANSQHGFHIHDFGDCSSKDAKSAGGHYAEVAPKGGTSLETPQKHAGDLPMISADAKGEAKGSFVAKDLTIDARNEIAGRSIMVHEAPDDPNKKAAPRIACGEIKVIAPPKTGSASL